jgi:hypothetical protein
VGGYKCHTLGEVDLQQGRLGKTPKQRVSSFKVSGHQMFWSLQSLTRAKFLYLFGSLGIWIQGLRFTKQVGILLLKPHPQPFFALVILYFGDRFHFFSQASLDCNPPISYFPP